MAPAARPLRTFVAQSPSLPWAMWMAAIGCAVIVMGMGCLLYMELRWPHVVMAAAMAALIGIRLLRATPGGTGPRHQSLATLLSGARGFQFRTVPRYVGRTESGATASPRRPLICRRKTADNDGASIGSDSVDLGDGMDR